jgi:hypothetical protein
MPCWRTLYLWTKRDPAFARAYAIAQGFGAYSLADQVLLIIDSSAPTEASVLRAKLLADQCRLRAGSLFARSVRSRARV